MTNSTSTNVVAKIAAAVAGLGLVAMSIAPAAMADTSSDQAMIASLQAQLAALQAKSAVTTTTTSTTFTTNLTLKSSGAQVTALQNWLIAKGFTISAGATGYFGAQTKAALAAYQASAGISPAAGYFGPLTRAAVNAAGSSTSTTTTTTTSTVPGCVAGAMFSSTTGAACGTTTTTTTGLSGTGEGSIDNFKSIGALNTTLNLADSQSVLGFEFKAGGSDLQVSRVDFNIYNKNNVGTIRPWGVFQTATLMNGSNTVGTIDVSNQANWSQDGIASNGNQSYRVRFDGLKNVVKMGAIADYYLVLSTQNGISSTNGGGAYSVSLPGNGLRATDAMGIDQYSSAPINGTVTVNSTTNGSVVLGVGSDSPQTTTVQGDKNVTTTGITLLSFTLQAKSSAVNLYSIPALVVANGSASSSMIQTLKLYQGSTLLDTESVSATQGATTTFNNINLSIPMGSTQSFKIVADINRIDGTNFAEGSSLTVTIPQTGIDVENGSNIVTVQGAATGNPISFRSLGLAADASPSSVTAVSVNNTTSTSTQTGTFNFTFNVTAFGQDIFVGTTSSAFTATLTGNAGTTTPTASAISSTADRDPSTNNYVVRSGQTRQITITLSKNGGNNGFYQARLNTLNFSDTAAFVSTKTVNLPATYTTPQVIIQA
jgi:hypothetical protein